jgi:GTPase SAR1 family protein
LFYRDADGAILVFDLSKRDSFLLVEKWFMELKEYAGNIKIVLVGNKCDLPNNQFEVDQLEAKELAQKFGVKYISASALDDINVNDIFSTVTFEIYHYQLKKENEKTIKKRKSIKLVNKEIKQEEKGCC